MALGKDLEESLKGIVRDAVREVMREEREAAPVEPESALLNQRRAAKALNVSVATLRRLRLEGLPCKLLGKKTPRFELSKCLEWIDARDKKPRRAT